MPANVAAVRVTGQQAAARTRAADAAARLQLLIDDEVLSVDIVTSVLERAIAGPA